MWDMYSTQELGKEAHVHRYMFPELAHVMFSPSHSLLPFMCSDGELCGYVCVYMYIQLYFKCDIQLSGDLQ